MKKIETRFGSIPYEQVGSGPALLVIHGGPGLDYKYMQRPLEALTQWRTLYYFNQYGGLGDPNPREQVSYKLTLEHIHSFVEALQIPAKELGILSHSYGALLHLDLLEDLMMTREAVFLNPCPIDNQLWDKADRNITPEDRKRINDLAKLPYTDSGVEMIEVFAKYDVAVNPPPRTGEFRVFDFDICNWVQKDMEKFDLRSRLRLVPNKSLLVGGEHDFCRADLLKDYVRICQRSEIIKGSGHMPFCDQPEKFDSIMEDFLNN